MNYHFFDYKYNIVGYSGQDFDSFYKTGYTIFALVLCFVLAFIFRKSKKEHMTLYLKIISIAMIVLEVLKVTWESYWDVKTGRGLNVGGFNTSGILSLETCSLFMYVAIVAGFTKNEKVRRCCACWLCTIGLVAGLSNVFVPQGLKWYPFWTFGAFHNMIYHSVMVLTALLLVFNRYVDFKFKDIINAFIPHAIFSVLVIAIDYITTWNYMLYRDPSAFPIISLITDKLTEQGLYFVNTLIVLGMFILFIVIFTSLYIGIYALIDKTKCRKKQKDY